MGVGSKAPLALDGAPADAADAADAEGVVKRDKYHGQRDEEGNPHGKGRMKLANGDAYDGEWEAGQMHGHGTHKWVSGAVYVGQWVAGVREGAGKYSWDPKSPSQTTPASFEYEGEFHENLRSGKGVYRWGNGESYEGQVLNDQRHGVGRFRWHGGREDVCRFAEGRMVGEGVRWSPDRLKAWRTQDGDLMDEISLDEAMRLQESIEA